MTLYQSSNGITQTCADPTAATQICNLISYRTGVVGNNQGYILCNGLYWVVRSLPSSLLPSSSSLWWPTKFSLRACPRRQLALSRHATALRAGGGQLRIRRNWWLRLRDRREPERPRLSVLYLHEFNLRYPPVHQQ